MSEVPSGPGPAAIPTSVRRRDEALERFPVLAPAYFAAMWRGDPLADDFVVDATVLGKGRAMRMLRTACSEGIGAVPDAPASLVALFAQLTDVPEWVDLDAIDDTCRHLGRFSRQGGIVLGAASLVGGYANSAASRPLELTGRYVESAGVRTIEVASWLVEASSSGGLRPRAKGFELTVRVRIIHALVRAALRDDPRWDGAAWGVPICQSYLAYTLVEFCLIPLRGMAAIGAGFLPDEVDAYYARWRYIGHLLGVDEALLPTDQAAQEALEEIYLLTRPEVDDYCRDLVAAINREFLVPEIEQLLPGRFRSMAPPVVHALERVFLGDGIADELAIPATRLTHVIRVIGPVLRLSNRVIDAIPGTLPKRSARGERFRIAQDARLRARYSVRHDLVDAAPTGRPHPARLEPASSPERRDRWPRVAMPRGNPAQHGASVATGQGIAGASTDSPVRSMRAPPAERTLNDDASSSTGGTVRGDRSGRVALRPGRVPVACPRSGPGQPGEDR